MKKKSLVVITGASSGIGQAMAKLFAKQEYPLLLLGRRLERMTAMNLPDSICSQVDITDRDALKSAIEAAEKHYGPTDCLINNAGVMLLGDVADQDPEEFTQMFEVNVLALLNGIQSVLQSMKARQSGTIINMSSIAGRKTFPNHAAYSGTKFAVHAISESIRETVAEDNVRVITIAPGAVETELLSHTTSETIKVGYQAWKDNMGGVLTPDNIAEAVLFAFQQPQHVCIREIQIAATRQQA